MKFFALLLLIFGFQLAKAQDDPPLDEMEVEGELMEDDFEDEVGPPDDPRSPPPPARTTRFRNSSNRFGSKKPGFQRGGGSGQDRLGKTEGEISFELVDPPKYYKRKNRPYVMPPSN